MRRNQKVSCVVKETDLLNLFWEDIAKQLKFKAPDEILEKTKKLLIDSREKSVAVTRDDISRIFSCLLIASKICGENFTYKTIADLGGIAQSTITKVSNEIVSGLGIK